MAATAEASRLTEAHRLGQLHLGRQVVARMLAVWPLLDPSDLDATFERWLRVVVPLVGAQRTVSARLAANYMQVFRGLELGVDVGGFAPVLAETVAAEAVATSMLVTGPVSVRAALGHGVPLAQAVKTAQGRAAAAAMRHALNGGRDTIIETVQADSRALGWARATSGKACAWCAMLASRGPVYRREGTADFHAHDHCSCVAEPFYRHDAEWPAGARQYRTLWNEAMATGARGPDALAEFRRVLATR